MKAALFDFDGTVADSMPTWSRKVLRLLEKRHIPIPDGLLRILTPLGDIGSIAYYREHFGLTESDEELLAELDEYALPRYRDEIPAKDGVKEYLEYLHGTGVPIYLLTASPERVYLPCLERVGLLPYFTKTWSCEDFGTVKSNPEIYRMAAERIGVSVGEIGFFDDNKIALATAKAAGCFVYGVFDESSAADEADIRAQVDVYLRSFRELLPK